MWKDYELIEARFTDVEQLTIAATFKMPSGEIAIEYIEADPDQLQYKELLKLTTERQIHDWTAEWKLASKRQLDEILKPIIEKEVEKRVALEVESQYNSIVEELQIKRNEVENLAGTLNQKDSEVQTLATDNKILVNDIEKLNYTLKKAFDQNDILDKDNKSLVSSIEEQIDKLKGHSVSTPTPEILFDNFVLNNTNDEFLFKIKLEVFKLENIKKSTSKKLKTDIRKAKTLIDVLNLIKTKI